MKHKKHINIPYTDAIIYCRVSSDSQVRDGHGLEAQEIGCRKYAKEKGYTVKKVYVERGVSGGTYNRPELAEMIQFIENECNKGRYYVLIVDEISRLGRDIEGFMVYIKPLMRAYHMKLETRNGQKMDTIEERLIVNVGMSIAEFERENGVRRVVSRMKERSRLGIYQGSPILGYAFSKHPEYGKMMIPNSDAEAVKEVLIGYAEGVYMNYPAVSKALYEAGIKTRDGRYKSIDSIKTMLTNKLYAGYYTLPENASEEGDSDYYPMKHTALISLETHKKILIRMKKCDNNELVKEEKKNYNDVLWLRGQVICTTCYEELGVEKGLSGSMSSAKGRKYPYYKCQNRYCRMRTKQITPAEIEGKIAEILQYMTPKNNLLELSKRIIKDCYDKKQTSLQKEKQQSLDNLACLKASKDLLLKAYTEERDDVIKAEIGDKMKSVCYEIEQYKVPNGELFVAFDRYLETILEYLSKPYEYWINGSIQIKQMILKLCFQKRLSYVRNGCVGNVDKSLLYRIITPNNTSNNELVKTTVKSTKGKENVIYAIHTV